MSASHPICPSSPSLHPLLPRRRTHVVQPPTLLTTSLTNSAHAALGQQQPQNRGLDVQTLLSTTSLSSPFSLQHSPHSMPSSFTSPMAVRSAGSLTAAPYNPQEWEHEASPVVVAPAAGFVQPPVVTMTTTFAPRQHGPDEPMASPPPPYSPQRQDGHAEMQTAHTASSSEAMSPATDYSRMSTPLSPATLSPMSPQCDRRTAVLYRASVSPAVSTPFPPPPPATAVRSASRNAADRLLGAMNICQRYTPVVHPPTAETIAHCTGQALAQFGPVQVDTVDRPPVTRRAASTGHLEGSYGSRSHQALPSRELILPGPPPGPPPGSPMTARSQSLNRPQHPPAPLHHRQPLTLRHPPPLGTNLGAIPPTPSEWTDEVMATESWPQTPVRQLQELTAQPTRAESAVLPSAPLHLDTTNIGRNSLVDVSQPSAVPQSAQSPAPMFGHTPTGSISSQARRESGSSILVRSPAVRNRSKGIRERRSESRLGRKHSGDEAGEPAEPLQDLVLINAENLSQRRMTQGSARTMSSLDETIHTATSSTFATQLLMSPVPQTPRVESTTSSQILEQSGPAISPDLWDRATNPTVERRRAISGIASLSAVDPGRRSALGVHHDSRPISSLLHAPNEEVAIDPLSPESTQSLLDEEDPNSPITFAQSAVERHRRFAEKEASGADDTARLHLFAQFVAAESRIRRARYAAAFEKESLEMSEIIKGMFEAPQRLLERPDSAARAKRTSQNTSRRSSDTTFSESQSHMASTAISEPLTLTLDTSNLETRARGEFVPCLSPIASMSAVTGKEEMDSRGRRSSRWWEGDSLSSHADGFKVLERTKRESKYMSAVLESELSPAMDSYLDAGPSQYPPLGIDEYPPEKTGFSDDTGRTTPGRGPTPPSALLTPDPRKLDISRLVTLPPPYPRRYPAVKNSHPALADMRAVVRSLTDVTEAETATKSYETRMQEKRARADSFVAHQKSLHAQDLQFRMEHDTITQEQFDEAETALAARLEQSTTDLTQAAFSLYQDLVVTPLHALYTTRIALATTTADSLHEAMLHPPPTATPSLLAHLEGDDHPSLLEHLTLYKWLFEARETLHRRLAALLAARNARYAALALRPYTNDAPQRAAARRFFTADARARRLAARAATLARHEPFLALVTARATQGVERLLAAFWDIAPSLSALLARIPRDRAAMAAATFDVVVPRAEVEENPRYWDFPLRYLFVLLGHAEASMHQLVEGQVSLWCLVQEVREGLAGVRCGVEEDEEGDDDGLAEGLGEENDRQQQQQEEGSTSAVANEEISMSREECEARRAEEIEAGLDVLKERVGVVEAQWAEGLGGEIARVKEVVKDWLERSGGWDDELEMDGGD